MDSLLSGTECRTRGMALRRAAQCMAAALLGWGGVSVHCQTAAVLEETELSLGRYLLAKALQAVVSALLALAVCRFLF